MFFFLRRSQVPSTPPPPLSAPLPDDLRGAIRQRLQGLGLWDELIVESSSPGLGYHQIEVRVPRDLSPIVCNVEISELMSHLGREVIRGEEDPETGVVTMKVGRPEAEPDLIRLIPDSQLTRKTGRIALIVDDFGYRSLDLTEQFCELRQPMTFSVLPSLKNSRTISSLIARSRHEVILHLPMEPLDPLDDPGEGVIRTDQSSKEIVGELRRDLRSVPNAKGVNNHMGSKATADRRVVETVLRELRRRGLFFIDSRTSSASVAYETARAMGVKTAQRSVFIDNVDDPTAIQAELWHVAELAAERGVVIAIGHNRPNTYFALATVLPQLEKRGFQFVRVSEVVY